MKRLLFLACLLMVGHCAVAADKAAKHPALSSDTLVWAGLDYSKVRMIGPGQFNDPSALFPGMLEAWNNLFLAERIRVVEKETKKKVVVDINGVTTLNKTATPSQIISSPGATDTVEQTHITADDIAKAVKGYQLENKTGLGVVFIVDRLVKVDKKAQGAVYVVAFDVASREIIFSDRQIHNPTGFGFRNYWFRVIKDAERALKKCR